MRSSWRLIFAPFIVASVFWTRGGSFHGAAVAADSTPAKTLLSGTAFDQQLKRPIKASWSQISLRQALDSLAESQKIAIVLDRRVDPTQQLEIAVAGDTLESALRKIADDKQLGLSFVGPVAYIGPRTTTDRLRTVVAMRREEAHGAPPALRQKLLHVRAWHWDMLTTPRELLARLSEETGIKIHGLAAIPHDLWPETDLPPLSWIDRLSLVAAEFGSTFEIDAAKGSVRLVPIPDKVAIRRTYRTGGRTQELARRLGEQLPQAEVLAEGDKLTVAARSEDHDLVSRAVEGKTSKAPGKTSSGKQVYKLSIEKVELSKLMTDLGKRLNLEIDYDQEAIDEAGISLDQLVSFNVKDASLEDLLTAALEPAGLIFEVDDHRVKIRPATARKGR